MASEGGEIGVEVVVKVWEKCTPLILSHSLCLSPSFSTHAGKEGKEFGVPMETEGFVKHLTTLLDDVQVRCDWLIV